MWNEVNRDVKLMKVEIVTKKVLHDGPGMVSLIWRELKCSLYQIPWPSAKYATACNNQLRPRKQEMIRTKDHRPKMIRRGVLILKRNHNMLSSRNKPCHIWGLQKLTWILSYQPETKWFTLLQRNLNQMKKVSINTPKARHGEGGVKLDICQSNRAKNLFSNITFPVRISNHMPLKNWVPRSGQRTYRLVIICGLNSKGLSNGK